MSRTSRQGNAHIIVIIVLIVALLGALGYIAWKAMTKEEAPNQETAIQQDTDTNGQSVTPQDDWKTHTSTRDGYAINYPEDWILITETAQDGIYIRNEAPVASSQIGGGYQDGYINVSVLKLADKEFEYLGLTTQQWYAKLGTETVQFGPIDIAPADVEAFTVHSMPAKRFMTAFTETDETIVVSGNGSFYEIIIYPYGGSDDTTVRKMLDSFELL